MKQFFSRCRAALLLVLLAAGLGACASAGEPVVEESNRILVVPFDCTILPQENAETAVTLQNMLASQIVYLLQSAGVPAEQYVLDAESRASQASSYSALLPASRSVGHELLSQGMPPAGSTSSGATSFEDVTDWNAPVVPSVQVKQYGSPQLAMPITDEPSQAQVEAQASQALRPLEVRAKAMQEAKDRDFDYLIAGTISMVRTEVTPTVKVQDKERATVRAELNCSFQLIYVKNGNITKAGAAQGRDAKMVTVQGGNLDNYHLVNALDKAVQQTVYNVSLKAAETLTDKKLNESRTSFEVDEEREYYQDSPGKRLRPDEVK